MPEFRRRFARTVLLRASLALLLLAGGEPESALGQTRSRSRARAEPTPRPTPLSETELRARNGALDAETDPPLDPEVKARARALYEEALASLEAAKTWDGRRIEFQRQIEEAPALLAEARAELAQPVVEPTPELPEAPTADQIEAALAQEKADLERRSGYLRDFEAEPARRAQRRGEIPGRVAEIRQSLEELQDRDSAPASSDAPAPVREAARQADLARRVALEAELAAIETELACYDGTAELLPLRRDRTARRVARTARLVEILTPMAADARRIEAREAERVAREAQIAAVNEHPAIRELADDNAEMARLRAGPEGIVARIETARAQLAERESALALIRERARSVREKMAAVGLSNAIGQLMRKHREELPRPGPARQRIRARQDELQELQLELFDLDERIRALADADAETKAVLARLDAAQLEAGRAEIEERVRELARTRRATLNELRDDSGDLFDALVALDARERELLAAAEEYRAFIEEKVLWIRSATPLRARELANAWQGLAWLFAPERLASSADALRDELLRDPIVSLAFLLLFLAWGFAQRNLRASLRLNGEVVGMGKARVADTVAALFQTLGIALFLPALVWFPGSRLGQAIGADEHARAIGAALVMTARALVPVELVRQLCRPKGLGEAHFRRSARNLAILRRDAGRLALFGAPACFVVTALERQSSQALRDSAGQLALLYACGALAWFAHGVLHPKRGVLAGARPDGAVGSRRRLWHALGLAGCLALGAITALGYTYSAISLLIRLGWTAGLVLAVFVGHSLAILWMRMAQSRMTSDPVSRRASRGSGGSSATAAGWAPPEAGGASAGGETSPKSVAAVGLEFRRLARGAAWAVFVVGFYLVWVDTLPALRALDQVRLPWNRTVVERTGGAGSSPLAAILSGSGLPTAAPGSPSGDAADPASVPGERRYDRPVTLADLALAFVVVACTMLAVRNLEGFLQFTVYQRFEFEAASRYAMQTVLRYVATVLGAIVAFGQIGLGWSKVQWLAAAITVGLGFGLQEIFANFVSGLIILFERPVRLGDIVTIGDVSGCVTRIRIRATTITDPDGKDLVVPNKEFITGRLVNWTLTDRRLRLVLPVGIAYEADPRVASEILLRIAADDSRILDDPPPQALFMGFGDSTLNLELRAFVRDLADSMAARNDLNERILREFRGAGIEIAFPQREVHIRTSEGDRLPFPSRRAGVEEEAKAP